MSGWKANMPRSATAFPLLLRLHYNVARDGGVRRMNTDYLVLALPPIWLEA